MPKFALRFPFFILMLCLVVALIGTVTVVRMPVDLFPRIDMPVVVVATFYNGMPPRQIEADITNTFESAAWAHRSQSPFSWFRPCIWSFTAGERETSRRRKEKLMPDPRRTIPLPVANFHRAIRNTRQLEPEENSGGAR